MGMTYQTPLKADTYLGYRLRVQRQITLPPLHATHLSDSLPRQIANLPAATVHLLILTHPLVLMLRTCEDAQRGQFRPSGKAARSPGHCV